MRRTVVNGTALLGVILVSTLVASQSASTPSRQFVSHQEDYGDVSYEYDATTTCIKYCRSRLMGTYHCCQPPVMHPNHGGSLKYCSTNGVGCPGRPRPVTIRPTIIYRPPTDTNICTSTHCNPNYPTVVYQDPVYTQRNYVCNNPICNPVPPHRPTVCTGTRCPLPPKLPITPPSKVCNRPDLVWSINELIIRSYARGYTLQNFIHGIQMIVHYHVQYSWDGKCIVPKKFQPADDFNDDEVVFDDEDISTIDDCQPCSTRPTGTRWCPTRFQTILGTCDNCCHRTHTTFRTARSVVLDLPDLREVVARLLVSASTMQRRSFIERLQEILGNARQGLYSWSQTQGHSIQSHSRPPVDKEVQPAVTTILPENLFEVKGENSESRGNDDDGVTY